MKNRNRGNFSEKAMSSIVVTAVRKAMMTLGVHASVGAIHHHIRNTQVLTGIRFDDLAECARQQRILAADWLFPTHDTRTEPPLIPPAVVEHVLNGKPPSAEPKPVPVLPVAAPKPATVPEPPAAEPEKKDDKRNQLDQATRYRVTQWIDTQRDFIARNKWHMGDLLSAIAKEFPKIVVTESNVQSFLKVINLKLAARPQPPRPESDSPEKVSRLNQRLNQLEEALTTAHVRISEQAERIAVLESKLAPLLE